MRLKATPDDFVVREATALRIRKEPAPYRVYMLEKQDWNTTDALQRIAKEKRISYDRFGYGGKKDRHAHTYQYITVQSPLDLTMTAKGYNLKPLGYSQAPMEPKQIVSNHFELTLRELDDAEVQHLTEQAPLRKEQGIPNYFDDQRFGNYDKERGFIAEKMLQNRWEDALNIALTAIYPEEHADAKQRKRELRERWGDWAACRAAAVTAFEQRCFDMLTSKPGAFRDALATVNRETAQLWVSTYQSFLWNEMLRRLMAGRGWTGPSAPGAAGDYFFPSEAARLGDLIIPQPGRSVRIAEPEVSIILEEVLRERRLRPASLDQEALPGLGFKVVPREALVRPAGLHVDAPEPDDLYPGKSKLALRFSLPRGSYATMVIKALSV